MVAFGTGIRRRAYLGLGSNLGNRLTQLRTAVSELESRDIRILRASHVYETLPVGVAWQRDFLNAVVCVETSLGPEDLLLVMEEIERSLGRTEKGEGKPRSIDMDLLFYDGEVISRPGLIVPHPGIPSRRFVLAPMVDIAPTYCHPTLRKTMKRLLRELADGQVVNALPEPL